MLQSCMILLELLFDPLYSSNEVLLAEVIFLCYLFL